MGNYKEIDGDLILLAQKGSFDVIAHGANCFQVMGAGIAAQISNHFPEAYQADKNDQRVPLQRLGDFSYYLDKRSNTFIFNLYTQFKPGRNLDYEALTLCLRKIAGTFQVDTKIGLPLIGCGIAGGNWNIVRNLIKKELKNMNVTIVTYNK